MNVHNHDQLARYDQHDRSLYDVRARSRIIKPEDVEAAKSSNDTLKISPDKIKEDALIRLLFTSRYLGDNIFASILIRIATYLFVAIAWPPYTVAYTIPKWIFAQGIPILIKVVTETANTFQKAIQKFINPISESFVLALQKIERVVKGFVLQPIFNAIKNLVKGNLEKSAGFVKKSAVKVLNKISQLVTISPEIRAIPQRIKKRVKKLVDNTIDRIKAPFIKIRQTIKSSFKQVQSVTSNLIQQVSAHIQPVVPTWMIVPMQQFLVKFDTAQNLAEQATNWLSQLVSSKVASRLTSAVERFHAVLKRMQAEILPHLKRFGSFLGRGGQQLFQWMQKNKQQALHVAQQISMKVLSRIFSWLPQFIRQALIKLANHPITQSLVQGCLNGLKQLGMQITKLPSVMKNWIIEQSKQAVIGVKKGILSIFALGSRIIALSGRIINRTVYWTLSIFIMSGIISGWGVQLLARVTMRMAQWIRGPRLAR